MKHLAFLAAVLGIHMTQVSGPHSTTIAFDPAQNAYLICIPVKVNGQGPFQFVLDSGNAGETIVTPELAQKLGLAEGKPVKGVYTVGLNTDIKMSWVSSIDVGSIHRGKTKVGVSSAMSEVGKQIKRQVDGNLGYEFLKQFALTIDLKKHELTFVQSPRDAGGTSFQTPKGNGILILDVLVAGKPFRFALDTGASFTCVSEELVSRLSLQEGQKFALNGNPNEMGSRVKLPLFSVAGKEVKDLPVVAAPFVNALSEKLKTKIDGVIGRNFWGQFELTIDYPHKVVRLN